MYSVGVGPIHCPIMHSLSNKEDVIRIDNVCLQSLSPQSSYIYRLSNLLIYLTIFAWLPKLVTIIKNIEIKTRLQCRTRAVACLFKVTFTSGDLPVYRTKPLRKLVKEERRGRGLA